MLTIRMITDCIREMLHRQYPGFTYYIQDLPVTMERPSFHIYLDTDRSEDGGFSSTGETVSVGVVYYPPVDGSAPDELKRLCVYDTVRSLFRKGFVRVGDRSLKVVLLRGGTEQKELYLIIKLVYADDRPPVDGGQSGDGPYQLIQEVNIKTN